MRILSFILLLAVSSGGGAEAAYKSGTITKVTAVRFEPTDASPVLCEIHVESSGFPFSFGIDGQHTRKITKKSCDTVWMVRDEIQFRIVGDDIFIKRGKEIELKGRLVSQPPPENRN